MGVLASHPNTSHPPSSSIRGLQACTIADAASVSLVKICRRFCNNHAPEYIKHVRLPIRNKITPRLQKYISIAAEWENIPYFNWNQQTRFSRFRIFLHYLGSYLMSAVKFIQTNLTLQLEFIGNFLKN